MTEAYIATTRNLSCACNHFQVFDMNAYPDYLSMPATIASAESAI